MTGLLLLLGGILFLAFLLSRIDFAGLKGQLGEATVNRILHRGLPSDIYKVLHDVTLTTPDGTTQIDHVVVSPYGVFIIETKCMSGWIFGSELDATWTQSFRRSRNRFQNPLRQNFAHQKALEAVLGLDSSKFHSVIVFAGDAQFKTAMPDNVLKADQLLRYIESKVEPLFALGEMPLLLAKIEVRRLAPGKETTAVHVASLKEKYQQAGGLLTDSRKLVRQASITLVAIKTFVGFAGIALILVGVSLLIGSFNDVLKTVSTPAPQSRAVVAPQTPSPVPEKVAAPKPSGLINFSNPALDSAKVKAEAQKQKQEIEKQTRWEASLFCAYSEDTGRCACYEPKGPKANVEFEQCMSLAQKSSN